MERERERDVTVRGVTGLIRLIRLFSADFACPVDPDFACLFQKRKQFFVGKREMQRTVVMALAALALVADPAAALTFGHEKTQASLMHEVARNNGGVLIQKPVSGEQFLGVCVVARLPPLHEHSRRVSIRNMGGTRLMDALCSAARGCGRVE